MCCSVILLKISILSFASSQLIEEGIIGHEQTLWIHDSIMHILQQPVAKRILAANYG
jgi:hypothetical protein